MIAKLVVRDGMDNKQMVKILHSDTMCNVATYRQLV